jgi:hypothetical protein
MESALGKVIAVSLAVAVVLFFLTRKRPKHSPVIEKLKQQIKKIDPEYEKLNITEGEVSETEDKTYITLCVRDPITGNEYSQNTLMYVLLHEIAHVITPLEYGKGDEIIDHGPRWENNFQKLLRRAEIVGVYNSSIPMDQWYCGIDTNPDRKNSQFHTKERSTKIFRSR